MQTTIPILQDTRGNTIIGDTSRQENLSINFGGGGNIAFFAGSSKGVRLEFVGNGALVFIGDNVEISQGDMMSQSKGKIRITDYSVCYVDRNSGLGSSFLHILEGKNAIIGRDCMFSYELWLWNSDTHMIFDATTYQRIAKGDSLYIGDHVWLGWGVSALKKFFAASGSIIGAKSFLTGGKIFFSNTANGGTPCKMLKSNIFWLRDGTWNWSETKKQNYESIANVSDAVQQHIFTFESDKFLNPELIEAKLNAFDNPLDKLRFLYNYLYCNTNKNRFALFKDSNYRDSTLYCDNPNAFDTLKFDTPKRINYGT